ncbi:Hypothetical predicted protein [Marmota monax]|uniref:TBC1 domain family member 7 n=1 Tax=Marmota monax TaxID=9995 RepID=A0A5E4A9K6_MARMO|nr:TBC1 domain family member 7 [Marmota monax]VTJ53391.1 Hypothetical predicted protein [Marmota monax]
MSCFLYDSFNIKKIWSGVSGFCLCFPFGSLGILPPHHESHARVMMYRKEQYSDVLHALKVIRFVNDATPHVEVYLRMYQLECGKLPRSPSFPLEPEDEVFLAIAKAMEEMVEDSVDCCWIIRCFVNQLNNKYRDSLPQLPKAFEQYLNLEDSRLLTHLRACSAVSKLPYDLWFKRCFAGCLPESSLQRVWDKVVSGSCKILVFVAVEILLTFKIKVMALNNAEKITKFLENVSVLYLIHFFVSGTLCFFVLFWC